MKRCAVKFTVFEIDYHGRSFRIGSADSLTEAKKIARNALRKSKHEYPCFIMSGGKCVADLR